MTVLQAFFEDVRALPEVRAAIDDKACVDGKPFQELLDVMERAFVLLETASTPRMIEVHDKVVEIISQKSKPVMERMLALGKYSIEIRQIAATVRGEGTRQ
jgi:hypothetical protein